MSKITLGELLGNNNIENFEDFDLTEVQKVLKSLSIEDAIDIAHCHYLQQRALFGADQLIDMNAKLVKSAAYLESKLNSVKNKCALEYKDGDKKITADMRKNAGEASKEAEELSLILARIKGAKLAIEKKLDLLLKIHYHFKEVAQSQNLGILNGTPKASIIAEDNRNEFKKIGW